MDVLIFFARLLFSALLYVFLGVLFIWLWRDIKLAARPQVTASARERPSRLRVLRGCNGLHEGMLLPLEAFTTIGRAESNTIIIADPYASGEHALLTWRSGQWWLEDRDSRNGTLVNDIPVEEPLIISHGDVIGIGQMQFRFEYPELETLEQTHTVNAV